MRSAALALAVVWLPALIQFVQRGVFTKTDFLELAHSMAVAALIVVFNFVQRFREKEQPRRRKRDRAHDKAKHSEGSQS